MTYPSFSMKAITSVYRQQVQRPPRCIGAGAWDFFTQAHHVDPETGTSRNTSLSRISLLGSSCGGSTGDAVCVFSIQVVLSVLSLKKQKAPRGAVKRFVGP